MARLTVQEFLAKVAGETAFRQQLGLTDEMDLDDFRAKAAAGGYDYTKEELHLATQALSDQQLDEISGGAGPKEPPVPQPGLNMYKLAGASRKF
ncbi:MAG: Nif11-like leader peptide family RiPP precursor [Polyangiaceae bacterium]